MNISSGLFFLAAHPPLFSDQSHGTLSLPSFSSGPIVIFYTPVTFFFTQKGPPFLVWLREVFFFSFFFCPPMSFFTTRGIPFSANALFFPVMTDRCSFFFSSRTSFIFPHINGPFPLLRIKFRLRLSPFPALHSSFSPPCSGGRFGSPAVAASSFSNEMFSPFPLTITSLPFPYKLVGQRPSHYKILIFPL